MARFFSNLKDKIAGTFSASHDDIEEHGQDYVELGSDSPIGGESKITVKPYTLEDFESVKPIIDALREGYTIALININPLKEKDLIELKRAIGKLKKTTDAINGDVAGFGDDWIVAVPSFARIYRTKDTVAVKEE